MAKQQNKMLSLQDKSEICHKIQNKSHQKLPVHDKKKNSQIVSKSRYQNRTFYMKKYR